MNVPVGHNFQQCLLERTDRVEHRTLRHTVSNCDYTCVRKFANLVVTIVYCSCPLGVNLVCVVGTSLPDPSLSTATGNTRVSGCSLIDVFGTL
jgi:hypothetical protein